MCTYVPTGVNCRENPWNGVVGGSELPNLGVHNWILVLWKSSMCCYPQTHLSNPYWTLTRILTKHISQECWRSNSGLHTCKADIFQAEISPHLSHMFFSVYHFTLFSLDYSMLVHGAVPVVMYVVRKIMNQDYECQRSLYSTEGLQWVPTAAFIFSITKNIKQPRDTYRVSRLRIFCLQV